MNIIDIWQPVESGLDSSRTIDEYYDNEEEARKRCNGIGVAPSPIKRLGLAVPVPDGPAKVFIFASSTPITLYHTTDEMKKERALSKLTPEERKLLGH